MQSKGSKRVLAIISIVMVIAIAGSAIIPLFTNRNQILTAEPPTPVPSPTFPPPLTNFDSVSFEQDYLHPSGLFSVAQPTGWTPASPVSNPTGAEITLNNPNILSVIQVSLQIATDPVDTLDKLDALYTSATLNDSWSNYRRDAQTGLNYRETGRRREDHHLVLDFELKNNRGQTFLARQVSWAQDTWVYGVRVVMPENAIDALLFMVDNLVPTVHGYQTAFAGTPADWQAYFDPVSSYVIRYPPTWTLDDSAPGRPASFSGDNAVLRVETMPGVTISDENAARAWVEASRAGATILSVEPAQRADLSGFSAAYSFADADGNPFSGLALLLNGPNGLYIANLRVAVADVDMNASLESYGSLLQVLGTFQSLGGINVPLPTPTPAATPPPTVPPAPTAAPTAEPTAGSTTQAAPDATAETTDES